MEVEKSCVDAEGNKTEYYDYVKTVNRELNDFSKIYTSFTWNGVMTLKEGNRVPAAFMSLNELTDILYTVEDLDSVASAAANGNVVCGVFEDGEKTKDSCSSTMPTVRKTKRLRSISVLLPRINCSL